MQTSARLRPILAWQIVAAILLTIYGGCWRSGSTHFVPGSLSAEDSHDLMVETLAKIASRTPDENIFVGDMLARTTRQTLQQMPPDAPVLRRWLKTYQLSKLELLLGNETEAMQLMKEGIQNVHSMRRKTNQDFVPTGSFEQVSRSDAIASLETSR